MNYEIKGTKVRIKIGNIKLIETFKPFASPQVKIAKVKHLTLLGL